MRSRILTIIFVLIVFVTTAGAASTQCPSEYFGGVAPDIMSAQKTTMARELCFTAFVVMHSGVTRTPLWSAEHLTRGALAAARGLKRSNNFHAEPRLPSNERAELSDYSRSGYDRGHNSPSGDFGTQKAQEESYSLAKMMPQDPDNNRHLWEGVESAVRSLAKKEGELYVITGPLRLGSGANVIGNVSVPDHIFKIVYSPKQHRGAAYLVENKPGNDYKVVSLTEIDTLAGINFFPNMSRAEKNAQLDLPAPTAHYGNESGKKGGSGSLYAGHGLTAGAVGGFVARTVARGVIYHAIRRAF